MANHRVRLYCGCRVSYRVEPDGTAKVVSCTLSTMCGALHDGRKLDDILGEHRKLYEKKPKQKER